jgi:chromosome segregation ATPase
MDDEAKPYPLSEAAELIGVSVNALRKRITRRKMRANRSNEDGLWRVWLTSSEIQEAKAERLHRQVDESRAFKALKGEAAALRSALAREQYRANRDEAELTQARALADQRAAELTELRERAARVEGEVAALRTQGQVDRERAAQLAQERDTAQAKMAEMQRVLGQAAGAAAGLQEAVKIAEAGQHDAENRAAAFQGERDVATRRAEKAELRASKTQAHLAQVEAEAEAAREQGVDPAELEAAQSRAQEAERRAMIATSRLDRIQRARIDEAHAAAVAAQISRKATSPSIWQRIFGRRRRS